MIWPRYSIWLTIVFLVYAISLKAQDDVDRAIEWAEAYLYDPASPYRNEEEYIRFLESLLDDQSVPEEKKLRPREQLKIVKKNRPGQQATDFSYLTREEEKNTLLSTPVDSLLLVVFFDPECPHCIETMEQAFELVKDKDIKVLAVYTEGKQDIWDGFKDTFPAECIVGINEETSILKKGFDDLMAMPTIYLVDKEKRVLLKDPTIEELNNYIK